MERRVAIVTGASRGIGRAIGERLAADGCHVVLVARSAAALDEVRLAIASAGGSAETRVVDVADAESLGGCIDEVASTHGRLDILVNNAGITRDMLLLRMTDADFDAVMNVNLRAVFVACRAAARPMMRGKWGRIINIGSISGLMGHPGQANYSASKAALIGLTKTIARELGPKGITANVVAPGFVETDMISTVPAELLDDVVKQLPVRRLGRPEEIANAVSYVASDLAGFMTAQVLVVDGGLMH